jgi:hypothetical protein
MKWIGGVILMIVTLVLLLMAAFMFPWFTTKTKYNTEVITDEYWENLGSDGRDWDESIYYLQHYELKSSRPLKWSNSSTSESPNSGSMRYNSDPTAGGWDGSYQEIAEAHYPVPGFLPGGKEQLSVYNLTYYMVLLGIILAVVSLVLIIVAGFNKISVTIPKIMVIVTAIFVVFAPIYFALALPVSIEADSEESYSVKNPLNINSTYVRPAEAGGIMGQANERDEDSRLITSKTDFGPGFGLWFGFVAIFTSIITIAFIGSPKETVEPSIEEKRIRQKYHEYDKSYDEGRGYRDDHGSHRGGQSSSQHGGRRYDDSYYNDAYYDDQYTYSQPQRRRREQPQSYDYGRPAPRPPRRRPNYPPPGTRRRQRPPGY